MANTVTIKRGDRIVGTYSTIQAAVNAAANGDSISVSAGVYQEQVTDDGKQLTITGAGEGKTIIQSPDSGSLKANVHATDSSRPDKYALVGAENGAKLTLSGLTIDGRQQGNIPDLNGSGSYDFVGIDATNASVTVTGKTGSTGVDITGIEEAENAAGQPSGNQRNTAVILDVNNGKAQTDSLTGLSVEHFQKNGIAAYGAGLTVNLANSIITGAGDTPTTAQNGLELINGATGTISNNTFSGLDYTGGGTDATSILALDAGSGLSITGNTIGSRGSDTGGTGNAGDIGVYIARTNGGTVSNNRISGQTYGIYNDVSDGNEAAALITGNTETGDSTNYLFQGNPNRTQTYSITGTVGPDYIVGGGGNDILNGQGDATGTGDFFEGGGGDDIIYGDRNKSTAIKTSNSAAYYTGPASDYLVTGNPNGTFTVKDNGPEGEGTDTLYGVRYLEFGTGAQFTVVDLTKTNPNHA